MPDHAHSAQTASPETTEETIVGAKVGHGREDAGPVPPDLLATDERAGRVDGRLVDVVLGEAGGEGGQVMVVGGPLETEHRGQEIFAKP